MFILINLEIPYNASSVYKCVYIRALYSQYNTVEGLQRC